MSEVEKRVEEGYPLCFLMTYFHSRGKTIRNLFRGGKWEFFQGTFSSQSSLGLYTIFARNYFYYQEAIFIFILLLIAFSSQN